VRGCCNGCRDPRCERSGTVRDPFGHEWNIGHRLEELTPAEMQRRYDELMKSG